MALRLWLQSLAYVDGRIEGEWPNWKGGAASTGH